jgi:hypothetical protein
MRSRKHDGRSLQPGISIDTSHYSEVSMALPLIPFAAGLAIGSLATYGAKDKALQHKVIEGSKHAYGKVTTATGDALKQTTRLGRKAADQASAAISKIPALGRQTLDGTGDALGKLIHLGKKTADV